jgi:hypothetical protein
MTMKPSLPFLIALLLCAGAAETAAARQAAARVPEQLRIDVLTAQLVFSLPADFVRATNRNNGTNVLIEFVPSGETVANWSRMVTIPSACKSGAIYRDFGQSDLGGGLERTIIANGCASLPPGAYPKALPGAGEQDFIIIFRDRETVYTLNYAERGNPFPPGRPPIAIARTAEILASRFGEVRLQPHRSAP